MKRWVVQITFMTAPFTNWETDQHIVTTKHHAQTAAEAWMQALEKVKVQEVWSKASLRQVSIVEEKGD